MCVCARAWTDSRAVKTLARVSFHHVVINLAIDIHSDLEHHGGQSHRENINPSARRAMDSGLFVVALFFCVVVLNAMTQHTLVYKEKVHEFLAALLTLLVNRGL